MRSHALARRLAEMPSASFGLARVQALFEAARPLLPPSPSPLLIHVAGTNGKGSVATKVVAGLASLGIKTGLFTSPHIASICERISVDRHPIDAAALDSLFTRLLSLSHSHALRPSLFELTTVAALVQFHQSKCAVAVVECGLGGRLDATNIITPATCVLTSVGLEHTRYLGDTMEKIAAEKAGIIKAGAPCVYGTQVPIEVLKEADRRVNPTCPGKYLIGLDPVFSSSAPHFSSLNQALALKTIETFLASPLGSRLNISPAVVSNASVIDSVSRAVPPCRAELLLYDGASHSASAFNARSSTEMSERHRVVMLDVAHNPPALSELVRYIHATLPPNPLSRLRLRVVFSVSADKSVSDCLSQLAARAHTIHVLNTPSPRSASVAALEACVARERLAAQYPSCSFVFHSGLDSAGQSNALAADNDNESGFPTAADRRVIECVSGILNEPIDDNASGEYFDLFLICGTFHLMKYGLAAVGRLADKDVDVIDLNEGNISDINKQRE